MDKKYNRSGLDLNIIYKVATEYPLIGEAPPLPINMYADDEPPSEWIINERKKLYRSICSKTGDILLIQNPAVWKTFKKIINGIPYWYRYRPEPKLHMTYEQAKASLGKNASKETKNQEWENY